MVTHITTDAGYDSNLPFSQGVVHGDTVYTAGQIPKDPDTRKVVGETIEDQTHQTFENLEAVLNEAGTSFENVIKATAFLTDMDDYDGFNQVYKEWMPEPHPARSTVEVAGLAIDIKIEVEMVAAIPE